MIEIFHNPDDYSLESPMWEAESGQDYEHGWYYWYVQPGCLPDSDPIGPFDTKEEALASAQVEIDEADEGA